MNVKRGAQGFSTPPDQIRASRRPFLLQLIYAERKEALIIVGPFTFLVLIVDHHQHVATRKIIKINPPGETICTVLKLHDKKSFVASVGCGILLGLRQDLSTEDYYRARLYRWIHIYIYYMLSSV